MSLTMTDNRNKATPLQADAGETVSAAIRSADALADQIANDPAALERLRQLILEGIDAGIECEADDDWLESLAAPIRQRAAARE